MTFCLSNFPTSTNTYNYHTATRRHSTVSHVLYTVGKSFENSVCLFFPFCVWWPDDNAVNANRGHGSHTETDSRTATYQTTYDESVRSFQSICEVRFEFGVLIPTQLLQTEATAHKQKPIPEPRPAKLDTMKVFEYVSFIVKSVSNLESYRRCKWCKHGPRLTNRDEFCDSDQPD